MRIVILSLLPLMMLTRILVQCRVVAGEGEGAPPVLSQFSSDADWTTKLYINEVVLGTGFGVLMGPHCANIFDPRGWTSDTNALTLEVMRVVLATGLFAIGVELPGAYMARSAKSLLVMVVPTMAIGWVISACTRFSPLMPASRVLISPQRSYTSYFPASTSSLVF